MISYSAVILDKASREYLINKFVSSKYDGWEKIELMHHTIKLGELPEDKKNRIGHTVFITATHVGSSDKALAVKINQFFPETKLPHITIAVNRDGGGKPKDSNKITEWEELKKPIVLTGEIQEVPQ
jgi:hypothetical protein